MTTLSKEDVVRMADNKWCHLGGGKIYEEGGLYVGQFFGDFRQRDRLILAVNSEETLCSRIADLVAENERLKEELQQVTISRDCYFEERNSARAAFHGRVKEVESLQSELTATRTALAAAEAREKKLREVMIVVCHPVMVAHAGPTRYKEFEAAVNSTRDDSALREMIAGVYEECASWYANEGWLLDEEDVSAAIRARAEKVRHGN